jgi:hypothetical protein
LLAADAFAAALEAIPADDWSRMCAANRTITLRRTSKRFKEVVDKVRLPAVVRLSRSSWDDARNGTAAEKATVRFQAARSVDSPVLHQHNQAAAL